MHTYTHMRANTCVQVCTSFLATLKIQGFNGNEFREASITSQKAPWVFLCYLMLWISSSSLSYLASLTFSLSAWFSVSGNWNSGGGQMQCRICVHFLKLQTNHPNSLFVYSKAPAIYVTQHMCRHKDIHV